MGGVRILHLKEHARAAFKHTRNSVAVGRLCGVCSTKETTRSATEEKGHWALLTRVLPGWILDTASPCLVCRYPESGQQRGEGEAESTQGP